MNGNDDTNASANAARRAWVTLAGAAAALGATASASAQPAQGARAMKIVLHVSDPDGWPPALSNARNLSQKYPAVKVRVIADGGGVYAFQGSNDLAAAMASTAKAGVEYQACHNALDEKRIAAASLPAFVKVVPAGVIALAESQADGFAYIKP